MKNLVMRGGEAGCQDGADLAETAVSRRVPRFRDVSWQSPSTRRGLAGQPWGSVKLIPIKDPKGEAKAYPSIFARCHDGPLGAEPRCPYDALALAWWARRALPHEPFPIDGLGRPRDRWWLEPGALRQTEGATDNDPLFVKLNRSGDPIWRTADSRILARRIGALARPTTPHTEWGASSFRSGGATDLLARCGSEPAARIRLGRRGRWASDIGEIYARTTAEAELQTSIDISLAEEDDLESLIQGWVQPARTNGQQRALRPA